LNEGNGEMMDRESAKKELRLGVRSFNPRYELEFAIEEDTDLLPTTLAYGTIDYELNTVFKNTPMNFRVIDDGETKSVAAEDSLVVTYSDPLAYIYRSYAMVKYVYWAQDNMVFMLPPDIDAANVLECEWTREQLEEALYDVTQRILATTLGEHCKPIILDQYVAPGDNMYIKAIVDYLSETDDRQSRIGIFWGNYADLDTSASMRDDDDAELFDDMDSDDTETEGMGEFAFHSDASEFSDIVTNCHKKTVHKKFYMQHDAYNNSYAVIVRRFFTDNCLTHHGDYL